MSFLDYEEIETLVRIRAKEIAGVEDLIVKFSNRMNKSHALCYWQETPQAIHFNKKFIDLNKNNFQVLDELIIHECVHLIPGYNRHNKKFFAKCRRFGIEPYGYSENYKGIKPSFSSHCPKCKSYKKYYAKPKLKKCKTCNTKLKIIEHSGKYGN
jgi:hypothetical protein